MEAFAETDLPEFLRSSEAFAEHLGEQLSKQASADKGESFLAFVCKVLPLCDFWKDIGEPVPNPKRTHDKGVDFEAAHRSSNVVVAGQSKYKLREVEAFDSIISKFQSYEQFVAQKLAAAQGELFPPNAPTRSYVVVTSSKTGTIRKRYAESSLPSVLFYRQLLREDRLQIVDGEQLLKSLQTFVTQDDSWEVAKSANYQNRVTRIDLEIARFLRPQLVRKVATDLGYGMSASKDLSISNVLDDIHLTKISHDAIKLLYLGIFSRHPNNLFEGNYSEVRVDTLTAIGEQGKHEYVMRVLFSLWVQVGKARDALQARYKNSKGDRILEVFKRFFEQDRMKYQCLLAIFTACGCVGDNLMDKSTKVHEDRDRTLRFIGRLEVVLLRHRDYFDRVFLHAFGVISERILQQTKGDMPDVMQKMFDHVVAMSGAQFGHLCMALQGRIINDDSIAAKVGDIEAEFP